MDKERLRQLLEEVRSGQLDVDKAFQQLKRLPFEDLGFAKLDTHRDIRRGFPEVIFCEGKTSEQITAIVERLADGGRTVMATRADRSVFEAISAIRKDATYNEAARIILLGRQPEKKTDHVIAVVSAGTSDIPVAEEAAVTGEVMGNPVDRLFDVGVAGVHRLLHNKEKLFKANVLVVVAGMEGALASVVGGLVDRPVIAVPTSIGYGASFNGLAALLSMLNCCAPGVSVMNIDNGFGAGYFASLVNQGKTG
ncbi:MAG: nickel pincer cofactor biosynthesis protein LarB [Candidatus Zixiibacteriota bacterium]|nr:MAG: nickel pincer cofactor biosynthesis protein LarB [candidate division Zixibacteria bacterium]